MGDATVTPDRVILSLGVMVETPTAAERIHKLRVSVRRATAALDAFAPCLPKREHKHARRVLRTVRRTAGAARDCSRWSRSCFSSR